MRRLVLLTLASCAVAAAAAYVAGVGPVAPGTPARAAADIVLRSEYKLVTGEVPANITLNALLRTQGIDPDLVEKVVGAANRVFDPRRLRSTQPFSLKRTLTGAFSAFEYEIDNRSILRVASDATGKSVQAEVVPIPRTLEYAVARGAINSATPSLFGAMSAAGERPDLAIAIADIFSGEIDFNTELQPDDSFAVAFERFRREDGGSASYGAISAVEFHNDGRVLRAVRYTPAGGKPGYYDEQGRSVRRFFLRSPLKFEPRVTSRFSASRMHPVLHTARAHRGVDYAAPEGAPVVAAASGTVISATVDQSNGRMIRLRHPSGYESYYLHLSAFAAGVHAGAHIDQGQTIGLVGHTGLATGPHLHYGLTRGGVFVNPLQHRNSSEPGEPLAAAEMERFHAERDQALAVLRTKE
jgi:murein DD-endopeptidase MepM/ murein hydrolase activator NlpD